MHYVVLYPQNGDRIVTIDSVTSPYPVYRENYAMDEHFSDCLVIQCHNDPKKSSVNTRINFYSPSYLYMLQIKAKRNKWIDWLWLILRHRVQKCPCCPLCSWSSRCCATCMYTVKWYCSYLGLTCNFLGHVQSNVTFAKYEKTDGEKCSRGIHVRKLLLHVLSMLTQSVSSYVFQFAYLFIQQWSIYKQSNWQSVAFSNFWFDSLILFFSAIVQTTVFNSCKRSRRQQGNRSLIDVQTWMYQ